MIKIWDVDKVWDYVNMFILAFNFFLLIKIKLFFVGRQGADTPTYEIKGNANNHFQTKTNK